jgi:sterol desaturase/sphingolipid hydroxylase (fatty acid hydroxylase superfamily)
MLLLAVLAALALSDRATRTAWVVENTALWSLALAKCCVQSLLPTVYGFGLSNVLLVEGVVVLQLLLNRTLYRAVPVLHAKDPGHEWDGRNLLRSTLPVHVFSELLVGSLCRHAVRCDFRVSYHLPSFDEFCTRLVCFRLLCDVVFYSTHRLQHAIPTFYRWSHARHHRHRLTSLLTNFQFTALDLFLEGSLPGVVATTLLARVWGQSTLELAYCLVAIQWHQIGSHNSKDLDCITAAPPLAPLYNHPWVKAATRPAALQEHRHVPFHAAHHQRVRCNYGITCWLDFLLGTMAPPLVANRGAAP